MMFCSDSDKINGVFMETHHLELGKENAQLTDLPLLLSRYFMAFVVDGLQVR